MFGGTTMSETPEGRFTYKVTGAIKVTSGKYHLFRDCSQVKSWGDNITVIDLDAPGTEAGDMVVSALGLSVCKQCEKRQKALNVNEVLSEIVERKINTVSGILRHLEHNGFRIERA